MSVFCSPFIRRVTLFSFLAAPAFSMARASDTFTKPTKEELSMTSLPGYPGVSAVVLFREEIDKDDMHVKAHYQRIKILTEKGKDLANVELPFFSTTGSWDENGDNKSVSDIVGRTIHADGTVIPFTGKPYMKTIAKHGDAQFKKLVFTLPDVEVGSIIEYRYAERIDDNSYEAPDWYIQGDLFVKSAHYVWFPTKKELVSGKTGAAINSITWFPVLPEGVKIEARDLPNAGMEGPTHSYEVHIKDVPPILHEEFQPPTKSFTYRVLFNFSEFRTPQEYWKSEGKDLFKQVNNFASQGSVQEATQKAVAGAATQEDKLKKIYAVVEGLENTDYTRERGKAEEKAAGISKIANAGDLLTAGRGSSTRITETFIGMARAAGLKAYGMYVPDRTTHLFTPQWLNAYQQLDDLVAIVVVDGKEVFFDPGERYCDYGHLAWEHSMVSGLRDSPEGPKLDQTPGENYTANKTARVANLKMDEHGVVTGSISLTYSGAPALAWRHRALSGDEQSIKRSMRTTLEHMVPRMLDVKVDSVEGLTSYEKPLVVTYAVKGVIANATGKRLMVPPDLFTMNDVALFPHEKREVAVYFHYPQTVADAQRIIVPTSIKVEAVPDSLNTMYLKRAQYKMEFSQTPTSITARRTFIFGDVIVMPTDYPALRTFYSALQAKDKEPAVLVSSSELDLPKAEAAPAHADTDAEDEDEDDNSGN